MWLSALAFVEGFNIVSSPQCLNINKRGLKMNLCFSWVQLLYTNKHFSKENIYFFQQLCGDFCHTDSFDKMEHVKNTWAGSDRVFVLWNLG